MAHVQTVKGRATSGAFSFTMTTPPAAGNLLVAGVGTISGTNHTLTDNASPSANTYTRRYFVNNGTGSRISQLDAQNCKTREGGLTFTTGLESGSSGYGIAFVSEISEAPTSGAFVAGEYATGTGGTSIYSGYKTNSVPRSIYVAMLGSSSASNTTITAQESFTKRAEETNGVTYMVGACATLEVTTSANRRTGFTLSSGATNCVGFVIYSQLINKTGAFAVGTLASSLGAGKRAAKGVMAQGAVVDFTALARKGFRGAAAFGAGLGFATVARKGFKGAGFFGAAAAPAAAGVKRALGALRDDGFAWIRALGRGAPSAAGLAAFGAGLGFFASGFKRAAAYGYAGIGEGIGALSRGFKAVSASTAFGLAGGLSVSGLYSKLRFVTTVHVGTGAGIVRGGVRRIRAGASSGAGVVRSFIQQVRARGASDQGTSRGG